MSDLVQILCPPNRALVVFRDEVSVWWLRGLRRGFRHCFVLLQVDQGWISVDPLLHRIEVMTVSDPDHSILPDLFKKYRLHTVIKDISFDVKQVWSPMTCTCVGLVKRVLGVRAAWVVTPYQLYCHLCTDVTSGDRLASFGRAFSAFCSIMKCHKSKQNHSEKEK